MSPKYKLQDKKWNCGLIAIENAALWANRKLTEAELEWISKEVQYKDGYGVDQVIFEKFLQKAKYLGFRCVDIYQDIEVAEIRKELKAGNLVVLGIDSPRISHVGLVVKMDSKYAYLVNWFGKEPIRKVSLNTLRRWLKDFSRAYILEKSFPKE